MNPRLVYLLFFLSGCAGLIYEIAWSRMLGLLFGHTVYAAAVVLAAYFAGMALGNLLAARLSQRMQRPLIGYGIAELAVALWALITPYALKLLESPAISELINSADLGEQLSARAIAVLLILLPATIALGATLPFIAAHVSPPHDPWPRRIALAYALNTAGAFSGVLLTTFALILFIGVRGSSNLAALLSALCGIIAIALARQSPAPASLKSPLPGPQLSADAALPLRWYLLAAVSGFGMLALQVLYTRMFALTFHNSTYTFGGVVAVFLLALATGGWAVSRFGMRINKARAIALACSLGGVLALASAYAFQAITRLGYFKLDAATLESIGLGALGGSFIAYIIGALILIIVVVFVPVALLGMALPLAFSIAPQGGPVGRLTAVNTIAATCGALLASFWLLSAVGLWQSFMLVAGLYVVTGLLLIAVAKSGWHGALLAGIIAVAFALLCVNAMRWPTAIVRKQQRLEYKRETPYGLITVVNDLRSGNLAMRQNNHYVLGDLRADAGEQRQGMIPVLLHPEPREICFLGLATGSTASAGLLSGSTDHVVAVELIPAVVEAARLFDPDGVYLDDPRLEIVVNDARHYLKSTERSFDVIVSDLFVPWHSQTGYLYTVEHYEAARERLADGGLFCQWLPLYQVSERELRLIADSFASVFPVTTVWRDDLTLQSPLIALIGSEEPLAIDRGALAARFALLPETLRSMGDFADADALLAGYQGDWPAPGTAGPLQAQHRSTRALLILETLRQTPRKRPPVQQTQPPATAPSVLLNTDDHPRVEFLAPISQRENVLLTGDRLKEFEERVLSKLRANHCILSDR